MSSMKPLVLVRNVFASAFIGGSIGVAIRTWRRDSNRAKQLLTYAATAGVSGIIVGYTLASIKRQNVYIHGLTFGGSFFVMSATFLVYRDYILMEFSQGGKLCPLIDGHPVSPMLASTVSGGLIGVVWSTIFWSGPQALLVNSLQGLGFGVFGQFIYNKYYSWKLQKVLEYNYPQLIGNASQDDSSLEEKIHWSEHLKQFLTRKPYSSQVKQEVSDLEIQLELLKEEEKRLQSKLTAHRKNDDRVDDA